MIKYILDLKKLVKLKIIKFVIHSCVQMFKWTKYRFVNSRLSSNEQFQFNLLLVQSMYHRFHRKYIIYIKAK